MSTTEMVMQRFALWMVLACAVFTAFPGLTHAESSSGAADDAIGKHVANFTLDNSYGKSVSLNDFKDSELIAIVFLGTECPLAKLYGPRLTDIQNRYKDRGVQIIGVNSNTQDSLTEMNAYVHRHEIGFPTLKDLGNKVADALGAKRITEVFLLDRNRRVRYHGRIDDQYGVGYSRESESQSELSVAIEELLDGKEVSNPSTTAVGCHIGRVKHVEPTGAVTFNKHIAPILNNHCVSCHRAGEVAPFTLTSYDDVLGWEDTILEVIADNRMPPWYADPDHGSFSNDPRLSDSERELISTWVDNGMPEGDARDLPPAPEFVEGWRIGKPDKVYKMPEAFPVPAEGVVEYKYFTVDPEWDEDKYIVATEARPGNRSVVHHIIAYVIPPGKTKPDRSTMLAGYAPGSDPLTLKDGVALRVKAGSKLLFQMHYTPNGSARSDLSKIGVRFTDKKNVRKLLRGQIAINRKFKIPAGASDKKVEATYPPNKLPFRPVALHASKIKKTESDQLLLSMTPHMHLRGKSFKYELFPPKGESEILLDVPNYDFNWQLKYTFEEPKFIPKGSVIKCTAVFDNSEDNVNIPMQTPDTKSEKSDSDVKVRGSLLEVEWGDQSFEEMMIGFMETIPVEDDF